MMSSYGKYHADDSQYQTTQTNTKKCPTSALTSSHTHTHTHPSTAHIRSRTNQIYVGVDAYNVLAFP